MISLVKEFFKVVSCAYKVRIKQLSLNNNKPKCLKKSHSYCNSSSKSKNLLQTKSNKIFIASCSKPKMSWARLPTTWRNFIISMPISYCRSSRQIWTSSTTLLSRVLKNNPNSNKISTKTNNKVRNKNKICRKTCQNLI